MVVEKELKIDDKYSVVYNAANNDVPMRVKRHGDEWISWRDFQGGSNFITAMFYALLEKANQ